MSYSDFCNCTVEEFQSIYKAYNEKCSLENREEWERTRILAAIVIQPHVKRTVTPKKLLPMSWDKEQPGRKQEAKKLTAKEQRERMKHLVERLGDKL